MTELIFTNARLVLPAEIVSGSLAVREGRIAGFDEGPSRAPSAIDCDGDILCPGLVEAHTDAFEKQLIPRPGVEWPALPALQAHDAAIAAAGITTVLDAVTVGVAEGKEWRVRFLARMVDAIKAKRAAGSLRADHYLHLRCELAGPEVLDQHAPYAEEPLLKLVSLMDHTPGQRQFPDIDAFRAYRVDKMGMRPQDVDALIARSLEDQERFAPANRRALAARSHAAGVALASHDDANAAHIDEAVALGVSIAEFPTTIDAAAAACAAGLVTLMGAPNVVRGGSHSGNVAAADLAERQLLGGLSSDYMPISLVHAPFVLTRTLGISLSQTLGLATSAPAAMLGFQDRGRIGEGLRADLVRLHETADAPVVRAVWRGGQRVL